MNEKYIVDDFDAENRIVYEFYGDYWHGNPNKFKKEDYNKLANKTFGELYKETIKREKEIKKEGYNIITIWENDFDKQFDFSYSSS